MSATKAHAPFHESLEDFAMISLDDRVTRPAIGVNQDRISAVERADTARPAIGINDRRDSGHTVQTFLEQEASGSKFMGAGSMTRLAGDRDDFFISGLDRNRSTASQRNHPASLQQAL